MNLTRFCGFMRCAAYCGAILSIAGVISFSIGSIGESHRASAQTGPILEATATFSNSTAIVVGTGDPSAAAPYPSTIAVTGMTGTIANTPGSVKVTLNNVTHAFISDLEIALVAPTGQALMIQGEAGFPGALSNVTYTLSDTGTGFLPDPTWGPGTYKPTNWAPGIFSFPAPGPGINWANPGNSDAPGTATFSTVFAGLAPNGNWNLFVYDAFTGDGGSIAGGWTLEITTTDGATPTPTPSATPTSTPTPGPTPTPCPNVRDAQGDYDCDGRTDYAIVRNAGALNGQVTWYISDNATGVSRVQDWGLGLDSFVPADYDGDKKDDIAVWRPGIQGAFYLIESSTVTLKAINFGIQGDNPSIVGDYNGDGIDDLAVYRQGQTPGAQSYFFVTYGGIVYSMPWGLNGDVPAPGDYDGDNRMDFAVHRAEGANGVFYIRYTAPKPDKVETLGLADDMIVPGYYDDDLTTDLAVIRNEGGFYKWTFRPSTGGPDITDEWGIAATDDPVPGDYDGDGKNDYAIYRPGSNPGDLSYFHVMTPITRFIYIRQWGLGSDEAVNFTFTHF